MNEKIENINLATSYLKDREILTSSKKDKFVLRNNKVYRYFNGSCITLSLDDFKELYKESTFYVYEDDSVTIDNEKDEAYYRYYRK